jgi:pimeloyl-ACP methyl ester carboxylesterase
MAWWRATTSPPPWPTLVAESQGSSLAGTHPVVDDPPIRGSSLDLAAGRGTSIRATVRCGGRQRSTGTPSTAPVRATPRSRAVGGAGGASGTGPIDPTPPETHPAPGEGDCEIAIRPCLGGGLPKYVCVGSEICFRAMLGDPQWPQYHWTVAGPASIVGPDNQQSVVVRVDGVGEVTITVSRGCATSITVFAVTLDLDVDSDNDDALASPDRSEGEEQMEQAAPGKLLFAALGSADGDAVPDFADGMNLWSDASDDDACAGLALVPVALSVSALPGDAKLVFDYDASDPAGVVRQSVGSGPGAYVLYEPAPGTLRLWRGSGASGSRDARSLLEGGDYIPGGVPIPATLVLGAIEAHGTLFLEAVQRSATASGTSIRASLATPDSSEPPSCATDSVATTAIALEIHDLREWGPTLTAEGTLRLAKGDLRDGATQAPVGGAITDGASICLLRSEPPVDLTLLGSHVAIIRRGDNAPLAPSIVGSMHETATTAGDLPALPIQYQAPSDQSASAPLGAGVALFVPPESYVDPNFTTGASSLNGLETCPMEFVVQSGAERGGAAVVVGRTPFVLRRPPIVLVHGILSSPATWDPGIWNEDAGQAHQTRLYYGDWSDPKLRSKGFSEGYPTVALAIEKALVEYRTANDAGHHWSRGFRGVRYAATRADVVGHSQGAQLARFYIADGMPLSADRVGWVGDLLNQRNDAGSDGRWNYLRAANWWAGSIRRLIALGSPFRGSPIANAAAPIFAPGESGAPASPGFSALMLWRLSGDFPPALESLLFPDGPDAYCEPSCVADLCQGSTAGSMLGAATYPSTHRRTRWFPVVGIASQPAGEVVVEPILWELLFTWIPWIPGDPTELSPLDPTNSDLIVSRSSQRNSSGADTHANAFAGEQFSLTTHVSLGSVPAETTSQSIRNRVAELLGQLPTSFDPSWSLGS